MDYVYTSTETRVYADRSLQVEPGDTVDWPDGPPADGHWSPTEETQVELDRLEAERAAAAAEKAKTEEPPPGGEQSTETPPDGNTDPQSTATPPRGRKPPKE